LAPVLNTGRGLAAVLEHFCPETDDVCGGCPFSRRARLIFLLFGPIKTLNAGDQAKVPVSWIMWDVGNLGSSGYNVEYDKDVGSTLLGPLAKVTRHFKPEAGFFVENQQS
jgi:hypothetical protein